MKPAELQYATLSKLISPIVDRTGLAESASFLVWFLENVYRLEETEARDAVCDHPNDKGIDGIYIDHNNEEIHFLQAKIRQSANAKVGDVGPKNLMASVAQFSTSAKIKAILAGNADSELKQLITRIQLADMVNQGYSLIGVYVTNESSNADSRAYEAITSNIRIYDRERIAGLFVDVSSAGGKKGEFVFDTSYVEPMEMQVGAGKYTATMYVFPAKAIQLVHMDGIGDGSLFRENVRYTLGNTTVNKSIRGAVAKKANHGNFILGHNGLIILCSSAENDVASNELKIKDYSVVNGAQSLTSFFTDKAKLTDDLRVLVRVFSFRTRLWLARLLRTAITRTQSNRVIYGRTMRS